MACEKHRKDPVKGYSECPGCEIERLRIDAERMREALLRLRRWGGMGNGWDSGVALAIVDWIDGEMRGPLPEMPTFLTHNAELCGGPSGSSELAPG